MTRDRAGGVDEAEPDEEEERETVEKEQNPVGTSYFFDLNLHRLVTQFFGDGGGVFFGNGYLELAVGGPDVLALQVVTDLTEIHGDFFDVTPFYLGHELAVTGLIFARLSAVRGHQFPEHRSEEHTS